MGKNKKEEVEKSLLIRSPLLEILTFEESIMYIKEVTPSTGKRDFRCEVSKFYTWKIHGVQ